LPLEPDVEDFMLHYMAVVRAGWQLLGAPQFDRLSRLYAQFEQEYAPGGPPMSPVYDSFAAQHILGQVPQGLAAETPYSVLVRLTSGDVSRQRLHQMARALADAHPDLYRCTKVDQTLAELEPLRGGPRFLVRLTGPFLRHLDRALARVVRFGDGAFMADSPYLLAASDADWLEYLDRAARPAGSLPDTSPSGQPAARARPRLTSKQLARRRQQKATAQQAPADAAVVRHLKFGTSERSWLDFITNGYAGERRGIVRLAGIPDRPETLPHHDDYDVATAAPDLTPVEDDDSHGSAT
jgi:hypothetical protein